MKNLRKEAESYQRDPSRLEYLPPRLRQIGLSWSNGILQNSVGNTEDPIENPEEDW